MTRTRLNFVVALAGATLLAGGALAQTSTGSMSSDAMSASSDHMSAGKTTDPMSSGALSSDHMSGGAMANDHMSSDHMAAHKHAKTAKKAKADHMTAGAMAVSH